MLIQVDANTSIFGSHCNWRHLSVGRRSSRSRCRSFLASMPTADATCMAMRPWSISPPFPTTTTNQNAQTFVLSGQPNATPTHSFSRMFFPNSTFSSPLSAFGFWGNRYGFKTHRSSTMGPLSRQQPSRLTTMCPPKTSCTVEVSRLEHFAGLHASLLKYGVCMHKECGVERLVQRSPAHYSYDDSLTGRSPFDCRSFRRIRSSQQNCTNSSSNGLSLKCQYTGQSFTKAETWKGKDTKGSHKAYY